MGGLPGYLFPSRVTRCRTFLQGSAHAFVAGWIVSIGLDPATYGKHTMRRTKATLIYGERGTFGQSNFFSDIPSWKALCDTLRSKAAMRGKWQCRQEREVCLQSDSHLSGLSLSAKSSRPANMGTCLLERPTPNYRFRETSLQTNALRTVRSRSHKVIVIHPGRYGCRHS